MKLIDKDNKNIIDNNQIKAHKIQDGLLQSAFVTIAEAEKRQFDSATPGVFTNFPLSFSVCHTVMGCLARQMPRKQ